MARKTDPPSIPVWPFRTAAAGLFLAQIVYLPGAASAFRLPKEAVVLAAFCLAIGFATVWAVRHRRISTPRGRLAIVLLVYPLLLALSALWAGDPRRALGSAALTGIWVVGALWMATIEPTQRRRLTLAAALGAALSVAVMLLQSVGVTIFEFTAQFAEGRFRLTGLTGNPADLAMAAALLLPLLLSDAENQRHRRLSGGLAVFLALGVLITQTLTGIAAIAAIAAVWLLQHRTKRVWLGTLAVTVVILGVALSAGLGERIVRESKRLKQGDWYALLSARGDGWTAAGQMVRSRPVTGVGAANFTSVYYPSRVAFLARTGGTGLRNETSTHFDWAHNDPFQLVAELGVTGVVWAGCLAWAIWSTRRRAGPLLPMAAAAWMPFALLHYPTHLAVGLIPLSLVLAHLVRSDGEPNTIPWSRARIPLAIVVVAVALAGIFWQLQRVATNLWMGSLEQRLILAAQSPAETAARRTAAIEAEILPRVGGLPSHAPKLWRTVGRTRIVRSDWPGAERAFRTAHTLWPHEESALYLGLSLVAQGRRSEGLQHLGQVCRTNPEITSLISDPDLRRTVEDMLEAYRSR